MRASRRLVGRVSGRAEVRVAGRSSRRAGANFELRGAERYSLRGASVRDSSLRSDGAVDRDSAKRLARSSERGLFLRRLLGVFEDPGFPPFDKDGLPDFA